MKETVGLFTREREWLVDRLNVLEHVLEYTLRDTWAPRVHTVHTRYGIGGTGRAAAHTARLYTVLRTVHVRARVVLVLTYVVRASAVPAPAGRT